MNCAPASERMHFVEDVDGDLWYAMNDKCYKLTVTPSASLYIMVFERSEKDAKGNIFTVKTTMIKIKQQHQRDAMVQTSCSDFEARQVLSVLFCTLVSNYSFCAHNTNDFEKECSSDEKEKTIRDSSDDETFTTEGK